MRKGVVFDFSLTQEEKVGGWGAREGDRAWRQQHPLLHTSSFPRYLVCLQAVESVTGSFLAIQRQVGGSQAGLWSLPAAQSPTQASMTNRLGFPCHNMHPPQTPRLTPRLSPSSLLSHSPSPLPCPLCCVFTPPGGYSSREKAWPTLEVSPPLPSSNRFPSLWCFGVHVRMLIPKTANLTPADSTLPPLPRNNPHPRVSLKSRQSSPSQPLVSPLSVPFSTLFATCRPLIYSVCVYWDIRERLTILGM